MTFLDWGSFAFGLVIGWFTYFVNRHRDKIGLTDIAGVIGAVGGGAVLALFPEGTTNFAAYAIGLAVGFFAYFVFLVIFVLASKDWSLAWFLDGRRPPLPTGHLASDGSRPMAPLPDPSPNPGPSSGRTTDASGLG